MSDERYALRRAEIETYFDRTAIDAWSRMTSDAPLTGIRATVKEGRDRMRATLLEWLPANLSGLRVLDAGCGTGLLAAEAARRGGDIVAVDLSPNLVELGRERLTPEGSGQVEFRVGDMGDPGLGEFDYVVAMDSLIHYHARDVVEVVARLAERTRQGILFTFAPKTLALTLKHAVGRAIPVRTQRAPAIEPVGERALTRRLVESQGLRDWRVGRTKRVSRGFYTSQAVELMRF